MALKNTLNLTLSQSGIQLMVVVVNTFWNILRISVDNKMFIVTLTVWTPNTKMCHPYCESSGPC
jgi:hypothetical protein